MWKVKYINNLTNAIEFRTYRKAEYQVRAIAKNMKGLTWVSMWRCDY